MKNKIIFALVCIISVPLKIATFECLRPVFRHLSDRIYDARMELQFKKVYRSQALYTEQHADWRKALVLVQGSKKLLPAIQKRNKEIIWLHVSGTAYDITVDGGRVIDYKEGIWDEHSQLNKIQHNPAYEYSMRSRLNVILRHQQNSQRRFSIVSHRKSILQPKDLHFCHFDNFYLIKYS